MVSHALVSTTHITGLRGLAAPLTMYYKVNGKWGYVLIEFLKYDAYKIRAARSCLSTLSFYAWHKIRHCSSLARHSRAWH
jgi:hypothetical protein